MRTMQCKRFEGCCELEVQFIEGARVPEPDAMHDDIPDLLALRKPWRERERYHMELDIGNAICYLMHGDFSASDEFRNIREREYEDFFRHDSFRGRFANVIHEFPDRLPTKPFRFRRVDSRTHAIARPRGYHFYLAPEHPCELKICIVSLVAKGPGGLRSRS